MIDIELEQLKSHPEWRAVLQAYRDHLDQAKSADPEHDGWLARLTEIEDVPEAQLPRIHGKLIALDLLRFELAGRTSGVRYQVTTAGRDALANLSLAEEDDDHEPLAEAA